MRGSEPGGGPYMGDGDNGVAGPGLTEETALAFMYHQDGAHLASTTLPADDTSCAAVFRAVEGFARTCLGAEGPPPFRIGLFE